MDRLHLATPPAPLGSIGVLPLRCASEGPQDAGEAGVGAVVVVDVEQSELLFVAVVLVAEVEADFLAELD